MISGMGVVDSPLPLRHLLAMSEQVLAGRGAIITGGSIGLGYAIAEAFVGAGAHVMLCARGEDNLYTARDKLSELARGNQIVAAELADISQEQDVSRLVSRATTAFPCLDILINNAAVVGPIGRTESVAWEAWRQAVEINLLGSVQLCRQVIPAMRSRGRGKILMISAGGATGPDPRFSAYAASKAGLVAFAATLAEELRDDGIDVNCIAPGGLATRMNDEKLAAGPENLEPAVYEQLLKRRQDGGESPRLAAELAVLLASPETDGLTGRLISAVCDDWRHLPDLLSALRDSDVYTIRRIVPADRGFDWPSPQSSGEA